MNNAFDFIFKSSYLNVLEDLETIERATRMPRMFATRRNYYEEFDAKSFKTRFRLSKEATMEVLGMIESKLEYPNDKNNSLSPINQLLLALRYYATGDHQISMGDFSGVSRSTAHRAIHRVTAAIAGLSTKFIKFPYTSADIRQMQIGFYEIAKFPNVIGALDCTHIKIISPGGDYSETFRNRKSWKSVNVQAICNADLEITDIVARWPGSVHDERIFSACRRNAMFELGRYNEGVLVADSGYMNRNYLMMPLNTPQTREEILYNESQIRTRNPIERLFGIWKRRFPVLALGIMVSLKNCLPVIVATAVLHNILQSRGEELPEDDPDLELPAPWESLLRVGIIRQQRTQEQNIEQQDINPARRRLINNYFKSLSLATP